MRARGAIRCRFATRPSRRRWSAWNATFDESRSPVNMSGRLPGNSTCWNNLPSRRAVAAAQLEVNGVHPRTPAMVFSSMGKNAPNETAASFDISPTPKTTMSRGKNASRENGMQRRDDGIEQSPQPPRHAHREPEQESQGRATDETHDDAHHRERDVTGQRAVGDQSTERREDGRRRGEEESRVTIRLDYPLPHHQQDQPHDKKASRQRTGTAAGVASWAEPLGADISRWSPAGASRSRRSPR
jgi:hypothetical protein